MMDAKMQEQLLKPFPANQIGQLPKGGTVLDFVSHAFITRRLLDVDPTWTWEPIAFGDDGNPALVMAEGKPVGLWIRLTVGGVTRLGYGSVQAGKNESVKELIGDALRNAAMRFGVALDLWAKEAPEGAQKPAQRPTVVPELPVEMGVPARVETRCPAIKPDGSVCGARYNARGSCTGRYNDQWLNHKPA